MNAHKQKQMGILGSDPAPVYPPPPPISGQIFHEKGVDYNTCVSTVISSYSKPTFLFSIYVDLEYGT